MLVAIMLDEIISDAHSLQRQVEKRHLNFIKMMKYLRIHRKMDTKVILVTMAGRILEVLMIWIGYSDLMCGSCFSTSFIAYSPFHESSICRKSFTVVGLPKLRGQYL